MKILLFTISAILCMQSLVAQEFTHNQLIEWMGYHDTATNNTQVFGINSKLKTGEIMWSPEKKYKLKMQTDGNLCIYAANDQFIWCTMSQSENGGYAVLQADGHFVVYDNNDTYLWGSQTYKLPNKPVELVLDDTGTLKLLDREQNTVWSSQ